MQPSKLGISVLGRNAAKHYKSLNEKFGTVDSAKANLSSVQDAALLAEMGFPALRGAVMDAQPTAMQTTASITNPVQFLQTFLPGVVRILQAPLKLEETIGFTQAGYWEDAEIVQRIMEWTGFVREYGDYQAKPNASWNLNFAKQNVVRFEIGLEVERLQETRAARGMVSDIDEKQGAAAMIMQQILNNVGYNGYNSGNNLTYGFLNNPNLPAYVPVVNGASSSPLWSSKTWTERQNDLITMAAGLTTQTQGRVDPMTTPTTLTIPVSLWQYFGATNPGGFLSLKGWFEQTYPAARIVVSPNMDGAASSLNAMYWFADTLPDSGTDDGSTFRQVIPARMMALGTEQLVSGYKTGYTCATAGTFCLRPFAVYRASAM